MRSFNLYKMPFHEAEPYFLDIAEKYFTDKGVGYDPTLAREESKAGGLEALLMLHQDSGEVMSFLVYRCTPYYFNTALTQCDIIALFTPKQWRGKGYGRLLVQEVEAIEAPNILTFTPEDGSHGAGLAKALGMDRAQTTYFKRR